MDPYASAMPEPSYSLEVSTGKQGRTNPKKPAYKLLTVERKVTSDSETMDIERATILAEEIGAAARTLHDQGGHRFDAAFMEQHGGAYGINVIALDTNYTVHTIKTFLYRPTCPGGPVLFRTGREVERILKVTYPALKPEEAGGMTLGLRLGKFKDLDVVFMMPSSMPDHPVLMYKLNLERKGDGSNTCVLLSARLCDGMGLGRSPPHVSLGKYKFLFPGQPLDVSKVKSAVTKGTKRGAADIEGVLYEALGAHCKMSDAGRAQLYCLVFHFFRSFKSVLGDAAFDETFASYTSMPAPVVAGILLEKEMLRTITMAASRNNRDSVDKIMGNVECLASVYNIMW